MEKGYLISIYIVRILCVIMAVILSVPIWRSFNASENSKIAAYYDDYYYISYDVVADQDLTKVVLNNYSNTLEDYELVLKINKENFNDLSNIEINKQLNDVGSYKFYVEGEYVYLILDTSSLVASSCEYDIKVIARNEVNYNFDVIDYKKV